MAMSSGRTSIFGATRRPAEKRRARRAAFGRGLGRGRLRNPPNQGLVAGLAPMTAIFSLLLAAWLGRGRAVARRDGEAGRGLEVEALFDLDGGDLVAQPVLLLADGVDSPLAEVTLARRVHPAPAGLVARTSFAHR